VSYEAIICKLENVRKHPNADKLKLADACNYQVIVGLDSKDGDLGVLFVEGSWICQEHLKYNNLLKEDGGYFEDTGRVKAKVFRKEKSEGFWQNIESLAWSKIDLSKLKDGDKITTLGKTLLCGKYYTLETLKVKESNEKNKPKFKFKILSFPEHFRTEYLKSNIKKIKPDSILYISEKLHGTSGRTGKILIETKTFWLKAFLNFLFPSFSKKLNTFSFIEKLNKNTKNRIEFIFKIIYKFLYFIKKIVNVITFYNFNALMHLFEKFFYRINHEYKFISGTRRTTCNFLENDTTHRKQIHDYLSTLPMKNGEILYYEIVGYTNTGKFISPQHKIDEKKLVEKYGPFMQYLYGCQTNQHKIYVYRITQEINGKLKELSWNEMINRCNELGINHVPYLKTVEINSLHFKNDLLKIVEEEVSGSSCLSDKHIKEGVVIRIENNNGMQLLKYKSFLFCELEGKARDNKNYVDPEEVE
jgi:hypothetical protein